MVLPTSRDESCVGKTPFVGKGDSRPRLIWGIGWLYKGTSGSGPRGGGEGGGSSSKNRGRGLGTINSDDEMTVNSDGVGDDPRASGKPCDGAVRGREGAGEKNDFEFNVGGFAVLGRRGAGERNGLDSEGVDVGVILRRLEGKGEAEEEADGGFERGLEMRGNEIFGRGGRPSGASETCAGAEYGWVWNALPDGLKRVENVKRPPCWRGASGGVGNCSCECEDPAESVWPSASRDLKSDDAASKDGETDSPTSCVENDVMFSALKSILGGRVAVLRLSDGGDGDKSLLKADESEAPRDSSTDGGTGEYGGRTEEIAASGSEGM